MSSALFFSFIGSLLICMALIPALTTSAWRFQFIDVPRDRRMHAEPIAKVGGIAFAAGTIAAVLLWAPQDRMILASLLGGVVILLFGMWDDRVGLDHRMKFAGQIIAAAIVVVYAGVRVTAMPFVDDQALPLWAAATITMIVIVGMTNAVNLADGLDGLAGGLSLISFAGIAYLAYQANDQMLVLLMVSVLGGLLGFLRFNTYPARVFMGDAGSQFLGHYLAVAAILLIDPARAREEATDAVVTYAERFSLHRPVIVVPRGGGRAAFEKFGCITCHMGDGRGGQNEGGYGADLRVTKLSDREVVTVIAEGRAGKGMPPFKGMIDDETLEMLAKYIKDDLRLK